MTIEILLGFCADDLDKLTEQELDACCSQYYKATRPMKDAPQNSTGSKGKVSRDNGKFNLDKFKQMAMKIGIEV